MTSRTSRPVAGWLRAVPARAAALAVSLAVAPVAPPVAAQQRPLDHDDVLHWQAVGNPSLSPDGSWLTFVLSAMEGDPSLTVRAAREDSPPLTTRGTDPDFTADSRYLVYRVPPAEAVVDSLKREGRKGDDLPNDSLAVVDLQAVFGDGEPRADAVLVVGPIKGHKVAAEGSWVAYEPAEDEPEDEDDAGDQDAAEGEEPAPDRDKDKQEGAPLVLMDLTTGAETRYEHVVHYHFADEAPVLAIATSTKDGRGDGVFVVRLGASDGGAERGPAGSPVAVMEGEGRYEQLTVAADGGRVAFLTTWDGVDPADGTDSPDAASQHEFGLYQAAAPEWRAVALADSDSPGVPEGWWASEHGEIRFSEGGGYVLFGTAPRPAADPDDGEDDTLEEDKVELDVWNWKDPFLQPMQLVRAEDEMNRAYAAAVSVNGGPVVQLGDENVPTVRFAAEAPSEAGDAPYAVGLADVPYRQLLSWDGRYNDVYAIDVASGRRRLIAQKVKGFGGASISPEGKYAAWWDGAARHWMVAPLDEAAAASAPTAASARVPHPVWNELDDHPDLPPPYGAAGWTRGDRAFLFYDRHDAWRFEPATGALHNLTEGAGRAAGVRFRYARTDPELEHVPEGEALWEAFHYLGKQSGFYRGRTDRPRVPERLVMADKRFRLRGKAADADRWLVTREDFREFPDLWIADGIMDSPDADAGRNGRGSDQSVLPGMIKMSEANPQQSEFRWGSAEIVEWNSNDGVPLQGILFKPDDFDPSRKHPMMVYFYERMSDGLHAHRSPRPGGSSISVPFYVSRGYVVFVPDIPYEIGYPGESALDAVVPGVLRVLAEGFVDKEKIGIQGHSWGGYQIAYMITKTNLFAAAEAGAPVSNMTSAYGGIRWQSGMSRMFQYERTQSRIGGSLWEATNEYLHNSPVFYVDKIETPLLMMHNDEDGAVPWYQGIEMFVAMRRLQKPVWMLNYNGEAHGLRREANRKDWAIRMQQFFDHYLKGAPAPVWLEEGIPAVKKGKTLGTEPSKRKVSPSAMSS